MAKITYKTSKEHTKKIMLDFFKKTSIPRMVSEQHKDRQNKAI